MGFIFEQRLRLDKMAHVYTKVTKKKYMCKVTYTRRIEVPFSIQYASHNESLKISPLAASVEVSDMNTDAPNVVSLFFSRRYILSPLYQRLAKRTLYLMPVDQLIRSNAGCLPQW